MVPVSLPEDQNNDNASSSQQLETTLSVITGMESTLYRAAAKGKIDALEEQGHLDQLLTPNRNTVLHIHITAAKSDDETEFVQEILEICPPLLLQTNVKGETPLHLAARYGHERIVKLLIRQAKTDHEDHERFQQMLRMTNKEKDTALHEAVRFGHRKVVSILTKEDPNFSYSGNEAGETPLYMAAKRGYDAILNDILHNCSSPATSGPNKRTVLHAVSIAKNKEMTEKVLSKFKDLAKQEDDNGRIPLHYAAELNCEDVVMLLLEHDKFTAYIKDKDGMTALHIAASKGHHIVMKEIISLCPDCCELVDNRGWNVLHFAVQGGDMDAVRVIVDDYSLSNLINEKDVDGNTPFLLNATSFTYSSYLANCPRVDKDAFNKQNQNALDIVSRSNEADINKNRCKRKFRSKGIRSNLRIARIHTQNSVGEEDDEYLSNIEKLSQAQLIAATLIATVTFAAGFTLPGGYVSDEGPLQGSAILREVTAFKAFMITDTIAMVLSIASVFTNLFVVSHGDKSMRLSLAMLSLCLTMLSMGAMVIAFVTGTYAVLAHSTPLATATAVIGLSFFIFFYIVFKKLIAQFREQV
ncbi:Ankyrin repeat-containing protein [Morus notabilis]|uniref:Ankyrin repeat-containing protein n=1 Tax=Morus notabilis TaxID=981085 RepID=W9RB19_9ROSA|nr:ankyrin repeat-containing protein At5g02620 isoform X2 [Morus notabilis]EXB66197.1 Ankyrin repeat-containing protein [Morus notabilis]